MVYDERIQLNDYDRGYREGQRLLLLNLLDKKGMVQSCINFVTYISGLDKALKEEKQ